MTTTAPTTIQVVQVILQLVTTLVAVVGVCTTVYATFILHRTRRMVKRLHDKTLGQEAKEKVGVLKHG